MNVDTTDQEELQRLAEDVLTFHIARTIKEMMIKRPHAKDDVLVRVKKKEKLHYEADIEFDGRYKKDDRRIITKYDGKGTITTDRYKFSK